MLHLTLEILPILRVRASRYGFLGIRRLELQALNTYLAMYSVVHS